MKHEATAISKELQYHSRHCDPQVDPQTDLTVSIDLHLLSKVNFDRVGPELGSLLRCDERRLWAL